MLLNVFTSKLSVALAFVAMPLLLLLAIHAKSESFNIQSWFPSGTVESQQYEHFAKHFQADDDLIISWAGCSLSDARLEVFTTALRATKSPFFKDITNGKELVAGLTGEPLRLSEAQAVARLQGTLFGADARTTCVVVRLSPEGLRSRPQSIFAIYDVADKTPRLGSDEIHIGGSSYLGAHFDLAASRSGLVVG